MSFTGPSIDHSLRWDDPDIGVAWPINDPVLSAKDADAPLLADIPRDELPSIDRYPD